jgi:hypothetical protein
MEKNLLLEINRVNELMGIKRKPLIMEQGFMGFVKMAMNTGLSLLDTLDNAADNMVTYGKMTRQEADDAVRRIKDETGLLDDIRTSFESSKLGGSLDNMNSKLSSLNDANLNKLIKNITTITQKDIDLLANDVIKTMVRKDNFVNAKARYFSGQADLEGWIPQMERVLSENFAIPGVKLNLEDFENLFNTRAREEALLFLKKYLEIAESKLKSGKMTQEKYDGYVKNVEETVVKPLMEFFENKYKYTNSDTINKLIEDYRNAGRIDTGPSTIPKPDHIIKSTMPDIAENNLNGNGLSIFRNKPTKTGTPPVRPEVPGGVADDAADTSSRVSNPKKYITGWFGKISFDVPYNLIRSILGLRGSAAFITQTQRGVDRLVSEFLPQVNQIKLNAGNIDGFAATCRELLTDMKLTKSGNESWGEVWEKIKADIRTQTRNLDVSGTDVELFIKEIETGGGKRVLGKTREERTIAYFLETMEDISKNPSFSTPGARLPIRSGDSLRDWTGITKKWNEWVETLSDLKAAKQVNWGKWTLVFTKKVWEWFSGWFIYDAPRSLKTMINHITYSGISDRRLFGAIVRAYISMVIMKNFISPLVVALKTVAAAIASLFGFDISDFLGLEEGQVQDIIVNAYSDTLSGLINFRGEQWLVFGEGQIENAINTIREYKNMDTRKAAKKTQDEFNDLINEAAAQEIQKKSDENTQKYNGADEEGKAKIRKRDGFDLLKDTLLNYMNPVLKLSNPDFKTLNYEQVEKLQNAMVYVPDLDPSVISDIRNSTVQDKMSKKFKLGDLSTDTIHKINAVMGYSAIKTKDGKLYKLKIKDKFIWYVTPSIEEIKNNPKVKLTDNELPTILDKL